MKILEKLSARNQNAPQSPVVTIACLGDSVTHGCFEVFTNRHGCIDTYYRPTEGYVGQLQAALNEMYPAGAVSMINAGVSGGSAAGGLERLDRDVLAHHPDLVIVNFALNDSCGGMEKISEYAKNMQTIMERVLASGAECMLLTPNRMCAYIDPSIQGEVLVNAAKISTQTQNAGVLDAYVNAAREAAGRLGVPVADAYAVWNRLEAVGVDTTAMLSNKINHPTARMHGVFVQAILGQMLGVD